MKIYNLEFKENIKNNNNFLTKKVPIQIKNDDISMYSPIKVKNSYDNSASIDSKFNIIENNIKNNYNHANIYSLRNI
jgi:hypothetical protein